MTADHRDLIEDVRREAVIAGPQSGAAKAARAYEQGLIAGRQVCVLRTKTAWIVQGLHEQLPNGAWVSGRAYPTEKDVVIARRLNMREQKL